MIRSASIIYSGQMSYYLDHLGVLCHIMGVPLIVTDLSLLKLAKRYYPQVEAQYKDHLDLSLDYLAKFDLLFVSDKFSASYLNLLLGSLFHKQMHFFFLPHGNSDKWQIDELMSPFSLQEMCVLYGKQMEDRLQESGHLQGIKGMVKGGNIRKQFYENHKTFYDKLILEELSLDPSKKTLLYAPTWKDQEDSSSFFDVCQHLLAQIPQDYNLIIKLHPFLEHYFPSEVYALQEQNKADNIRFLIHFPLIYPLLNIIDIYLGDFSAVGYDFLSFNRPMFFFNPKERKDKGTYLHKCGITIPTSAYQKLFPFIEQNLNHDFTSIRASTYNYAFYPDKPFQSLRDEILSTYNNCL